MNAYDGAGFAALCAGNAPEAASMFRRALELFPEHARSLVGLGAALACRRAQLGGCERLPGPRPRSMRFAAADAAARRRWPRRSCTRLTAGR